MSRIYGADELHIEGLNGLSYTLEGAADELDRLEDRADELRHQLNMRNDRATKRRLQRRLARYEAESDHLHAALNPPCLNGEGYSGGAFNPGVIAPCRSSNCSNRLTRSLAHRTLGFCPPCFERATNPKGHTI